MQRWRILWSPRIERGMLRFKTQLVNRWIRVAEASTNFAGDWLTRSPHACLTLALQRWAALGPRGINSV